MVICNEETARRRDGILGCDFFFLFRLIYFRLISVLLMDAFEEGSLESARRQGKTL